MVETIAFILSQQKAPLERRKLFLPPLKAGQVIVKMAYTGLCHTQLNEILGKKGHDPYMPHTLGHEGSGVVESIGPGVTKVHPGDHVVVSWLKGAGIDVSSAQYESDKGVVNSGAVSTFLTKAVISENRLIPIPKEMPLKEAALLGCALPTGAGVVFKEMHLKKGQSFALFGAGGIGLSALIAAKKSGADPLIVVDICLKKLAFVKELGATHVIYALEEKPSEKIREITKGGVDFCLEAAGRKEVMEEAFNSLKPGGLCVLAGNLPKGEKIEIDPFDLIIGKRIIGTWGGKATIDQDVKLYVEAYLAGSLPLSPLITRVLPFEEINILVEELQRGLLGRGLLTFS